MHRSAITLLAVLMLPAVLNAQTAGSRPSNRPGGGVTVGVGMGSLGMALVGSMDLRVEQHIVTLRAAATTELFGDERWDAALLYGRRFPMGDWSLETSVGAGIVVGEQGGSLFNDGTDIEPRLGFAAQAGFFLRPTSFFGIGLLGFANINGAYDFAGVTVAVRLGTG